MNKIIYCINLAFLCYVGLSYEAISQGFAAKTNDGPFYCNELKSSGGDDSAMMFSLLLFLLPLLVRLIKFSQPIANGEFILIAIVASLTVFALFLASLDCAEIWYTAFIIPDAYLAGAIICIPLSVILAWKLKVKNE